jgi:uncharacterized protein (DUF305 family)
MSFAVLGLGILAGCSSTESADPVTASSSQAGVSATDVAFAQSMIPHHQQAVEMADLALSADSGASEQVQQLAEQIKAAQDPEIQQMTDWLQSWNAPTAMPGASQGADMQGMDHRGHDMGGITMAGMMTAEQMDELQQASGEQFDQMWLTMMIAHHEGAVAMAEQVRSSSDPNVSTLADNIISSQQAEIEQMKAMLSS